MKITNPRCFNQIKLLNHGKYIEKSSNDVEKFINEINWYINSPALIKEYIPNIIDYSENKKLPWIKYEAISGKTIHQTLFSLTTKMDYEAICLAYKKFFLVCNSIKPKNLDIKYWKKNLIKFYLDKTISRIKEISNLDHLSFFFKGNFITINKNKYPSVKTIIKYLIDQKKKLEKSTKNNKPNKIAWICTPTKDRICFCHGDVVFSNVFAFFDRATLKVIDPRGSFGDDKKYGDIYYDYAKIYQCLYGYYDYIIEDKFRYKITNKHLEYKIYTTQRIFDLQDVFNEDAFIKKTAKEIKLIESLQFLSMVALHNDNKDRQIIMLATGVQHFCDIIKLWK